jgi:hypothetical protein
MYIYKYICIYICVYIFINICMYSYMYICIYLGICDCCDGSDERGGNHSSVCTNTCEQDLQHIKQVCYICIFYYLYVDSLTYAFDWFAFFSRIRFCDTLVVIFLLSKHHHHRILFICHLCSTGWVYMFYVEHIDKIMKPFSMS